MLANPYDLNITKSTKVSYGFYVTYRDRLCFYRFAALYAAKRFLEIVIDNDKYTWQTWAPARGIKPEPLLVTSRGVKIRGYGLEDALEYAPTKEEAAFRFDAIDEGTYANIPRDEPHSLLGLQSTTPLAHVPAELVKTPRHAPSSPKSTSSRTPKASKVAGMITIGEIAQNLSIEPRVARGILRDTKTPKPASGNWAWSTSDAEVIITLLKGATK